jgi:LysR family glycine cleavage system transcriptional activator
MERRGDTGVRVFSLAQLFPPLNPLHVFEVAARVGRFTRAAEILNVSPSAVSRQIATLESFLNVRLFDRTPEGNVLTKLGQEYYRGISPAFDTITSTTDRVMRSQDRGSLNVRATATFAVRFLIPLLSEFKQQQPRTNVHVITGFPPVDFAHEEIDLAIQIGAGNGIGTESKVLFANWIQPMCNPKLLKNGNPIKHIDDLCGYRLLASRNRRSDWRNWFNAMGRADFPLERMEIVEFSSSHLAYHAAADGLGIVLGQLPLLGPEFGAQIMIRLFDKPVRHGSYYVVWRAETGASRKVQQFISWLQRDLEPILARLPADYQRREIATTEPLSNNKP